MPGETSLRDKKLKADFEKLTRLRDRSRGWLDFEVLSSTEPPDSYLVTLNCRGVKFQFGEVQGIDEHKVAIYLGPEYPGRTPTLVWQTPIYHPNIVQPGVCILGQWTPKTSLDELCLWLWEMACYRLYNLSDMLDRSNTKLKTWVEEQERQSKFPLDLHDLRTIVTANATQSSAQPRPFEESVSDEEILKMIRLR